ncbi:Cytochrome oxidase assembly factor 4 [Desmophyllum pertusum]|uniref:Cytochrome oxidase assembly factor 4 n=1 Tax=Desmophyllum pertusum TaxID=174260 RepID=A0A9W9YP20_9CNID|nr:Cytochrome oxidase assembly factor 4 [Desmophyllum pertusum]
MSQHGGRSLHGHRKPEKEETGKEKVELAEEEEEEEDPFDTRIKKSGCADLHYALMDCMDKQKDWRKCQEHVKGFKACIDQQKQLKKP